MEEAEIREKVPKKQGLLGAAGASRGSGALLTPWFRTSGLRKCERMTFCRFRPLFVGIC